MWWKRLAQLGGGLGVLAGLLYWQIIIGEGSYLGPRVVRLIYRWGAPFYDHVRRRVTEDDAVHLLPPLRLALLETPTAAVLDVATGTGRVPLLLAAEPWFQGPLYGLDLTPAMVEQARRKAEAAGVAERINWVIGSGDRLDQWSADCFGMVSCLEALEYFPRPRRALREMWRVLQPGGVLLISTWTPAHARWLPGKAWTARGMQRYLRKLGATTVEVQAWQAGYELVLATKHGSMDR